MCPSAASANLNLQGPYLKYLSKKNIFLKKSWLGYVF